MITGFPGTVRGRLPERSEVYVIVSNSSPAQNGRGGKPRRLSVLLTIAACFVAAAAFGCKREERSFRQWPPAGSPSSAIHETDLQPGPQLRSIPIHNSYEDNAYGVSQGKTLYNQFNCSGCHFQGGGGIGPPLMDAEWIYGSQPENIFETIVEGRPNGMPSFRGKISNDQVWQLVAYVRSMSGLLRKDVASGRNDDMQVRTQEQSTEKMKPVQSAVPKSAERP
jgi:cytochrome c oxidase cbb3-type subunit III